MRIPYLVTLLFFLCSCEQQKNATKGSQYNSLEKNNSKHKYSDIKQENDQDSGISEKWFGKYEGSFLRMSNESADPRAWASVEFNISSVELTFYYFSYPEQDINHNLELISEKSESLVLKIKGDNETDNKYHIYKKGNKIFLENTYINNLMGRKEIVELNKLQ